MKLMSWNVNGLRACVDKGFFDFWPGRRRTCCACRRPSSSRSRPPRSEGYHTYWNSAEKKGYSGVALLTREIPASVTYGIGIDEHDHEAG